MNIGLKDLVLDFSHMESLRTTKSEATALVVTAISTVAFDLIWGMAIGIALHILLSHYSKWQKAL